MEPANGASRDQREAISSSSVARAIKARGQTTLTRQCSMPLEQSLTSISTRQDNRDAIGGYCNVSSPPYSAPMSSATAASWGERGGDAKYALVLPQVNRLAH